MAFTAARLARSQPFGQQPRQFRTANVCPCPRPTKRSPASRGLLGVDVFNVNWGFNPGVVRESNPRQPDYGSGALPSELTTLARRNLRHNPFAERAQPTTFAGWSWARHWPSCGKPSWKSLEYRVVHKWQDAAGSQCRYSSQSESVQVRFAGVVKYPYNSAADEVGARSWLTRAGRASLREYPYRRTALHRAA